MGMRFTEEQQKVIDARNRNLLVSAAAGSGKTAVLVERIITRITEKENPIDIDRLLIVTFTNAAAAEMRERIAAAIEKQLTEHPEDVHLQRQQTLLHNARITTIHSFCLFVIRNYFHKIDLEPDFRIGEEGELKLLKQDVIEDVLEQYYQSENADFITLSETLATGKNDEKLKETILDLYEFAMSDPWPEEWLEQCVSPYEVENLEEFQQQPVYHALMYYLKAVTSQWVQMMEQCVELCQEPDGPEMYADFLSNECEMLEQVLECEDYASYERVLQSMTFGRLPGARKFQGDLEKKQYVQDLRNEIKESRKKLLEQFFFVPVEEMLQNLQQNASKIRMLVQVTKTFIEAYSEKKLEKNMLDFNDLEHYALKILVENETKQPSPIAEELRTQFAEIMIDEYQDSNYVQETILRSIAEKDNRFMVGDVKQSIYRFRMARPELFMEKYDTYTTEESENQRIDLHKNFRSRGEVLKTVNDIFYCIMARNLGNVEYDSQAALYQGRTFPEDDNREMFGTEILIADPKEYEDAEQAQDVEAVMIAEKIKKLMNNQLVTDKETGELRPMRFGDVVILMRGISGWGERVVEVLKEHGIPAQAATGTGYFSALEVQTLLNMLRLIDNPRQDIPMAAVLQSPIVGLTEEDLAKIRVAFPQMPFHQSVIRYEQEGTEERIQQKLQKFFEQIKEFQEFSQDVPVHELLYRVMDETDYFYTAYAMPGGAVRKANLEMLLEKAIAYEKTSYHGLFQFIRYINQLQKYEVDYGEAEDIASDDTVHVMTIHKSKGLEFPVVFVAGMGRLLNQQDARNRMVRHPQYGIGLDFTDVERRVRIPTLMRQVLARQIQMENAGEEMRVLYVALTRAKEKLVLTGTMKKAEEKLKKFSYMTTDKQGHMGFLGRLSAGCYFDWVLPALLQSADYKIHLVSPEELTLEQASDKIEKEWSKEWLLSLAEQPQEDLLEEIENRLSYRYAYASEQDLKTKLSVSELKHRAIDRLREEETETSYVFEEPQMIPYIPEFMREEQEVENMGALRGTAMHRVMECFDFAQEPDTLKEQLKEMQESGKLEERFVELLSIPKLEGFLHSELATRMKQAAKAGKLFKEKPFMMGKPSSEVLEQTDCNVMILVQGIIDVFFEEDGEIVLVDYKTDAVKTGEELAKRYQTQMDLYQDALQRATGKTVKEKILYSFKLDEGIRV